MSASRTLLDLLKIPVARRSGLAVVLGAVQAADRVVLTTHVNADGDGTGSEVALGAWLTRLGKRPVIVNPTPFPDHYRHLVPDELPVMELGGDPAGDVLDRADLLFIVDTSEPKRIGKLARLARDRPLVVLDHHPPSPSSYQGAGVLDPSAAAAGELVYDLLLEAELEEPWPEAVVRGLYAALLTDTGSFRFSNTSARVHLIVADLIRRGLDPEPAYRDLYGRISRRKMEILRLALNSLEQDPEVPVSWISLPRTVSTELKATPDDLDGIVDYARDLEGTEVAILFRETVEGGTKLSLRSNGAVDVNHIAREFGGGGHARAAGAVLGQPLEEGRARVLDAVRDAVRSLEEDPGPG